MSGSRPLERQSGLPSGGAPAPVQPRRAGPWLLLLLAVVAVITGAAVVGLGTREPVLPPAETSAGRPLLRVDRDLINLGRVPLGEWVEAQFLLTNAGDARWQLTAMPYVRAVAGC